MTVATEPAGAVLTGGAVWGRHSVTQGAEIQLGLGPITMTLRREGEELWIADPTPGRVAVGYAGRASTDAASEWTRWAAPEAEDALVLPALADRPVVVAPEVSFSLTPRAEARVYVRIPLWVRVAFAEAPDLPLVEAPTYVMSDTWWGDLASGELAYWLPTRARRRIDDELFEPHLVMCAVELINESEEVLPVEKLAVRVQHMPIFRDGERLWAAETRVRYEAGDEGSAIDIGDRPPREAAGAELLSRPRTRPDKGFRARTFGRFKLGLGG